MRDPWQAVAATNSFDQGGSQLVYSRRCRAGRPITAEHGRVWARLGDIGVGVMSSRDHDGSQQVHDAGITASCCGLKQGHMGGQSDVRWNPPAREVGDQQGGGAIVA